MRFVAKLVTDRELERPFQRFAPDLVNAEAVAREFLADAKSRTPMNGCVPGDAMEVYENRQVLVCTLLLMSDGTVDRLTPPTEGK